MPNPPFQPLTLSEPITHTKVWSAVLQIANDPDALSWDKGALVFTVKALAAECEAQAQAAAQWHKDFVELAKDHATLRQRLDELERACANHCATENRLTAQLEQAQKERDEAQAALVTLTADIPKTEKRLEQTAAKANLRAVDAEAKCAQLVQDINERCREIHQLRDEAKFDPEVTFGWYREQLSRTEARASQAEAALEEMRGLWARLVNFFPEPTHWMPLPAAPRSVVAPEKE